MSNSDEKCGVLYKTLMNAAENTLARSGYTCQTTTPLILNQELVSQVPEPGEAALRSVRIVAGNNDGRILTLILRKTVAPNTSSEPIAEEKIHFSPGEAVALTQDHSLTVSDRRQEVRFWRK
jgi:hypothetical protein